ILGGSHNLYDWKVDIFRDGQSTPDFTLDPTGDSDLNDKKMETAGEDVMQVSISGYALTGTGTGISGAIMNGLPASPVTSGTGFYTATVPLSWFGTVTPTHATYMFSPTSKIYSNVTSSKTTENYTGTLKTFEISGYVRISVGSGIAGVAVGGLTGSPVTNASGYYVATVSYGWSGTATPSLTGYSFTPPSRNYSNVTASQNSQDYTGTPGTYTISGYVLTGTGAGIPGAIMNGLPASPVTSGAGFYTATVPLAWSGTVTPSHGCYTFTPSSKSYNGVASNYGNENYVGTLIGLPGPPGGLSIDPGTGCVDQSYRIYWNPGAGATSYEIRENGGPWADVGSSGQATFTKSSPGSFTYDVRSKNGCGVSGSPYSTAAQAVFAPPGPPGGLSVDPHSGCVNQSYRIYWNAGSGAMAYEIRENGGSWVDLGGNGEATFTKSSPGTFNYEVRSKNSCGVSALPYSTATQSVIAPPGAPGGLSVVPNQGCINQSYRIYWNLGTGATSYEIRENGDAWVDVGGSGEATLTKSDPGNFTYEVRSKNSCGVSAIPYSTATQTVIAPPESPGGLSVDPNPGCVGQPYRIYWNPGTWATSYEVRENGGAWLDFGNSGVATFTKFSPDKFTYEVRSKNNCGVSDPPYSAAAQSVISDAAPPTIGAHESCVKPGNDGWCRADVTVALGASDEAWCVSGIDYIEYRSGASEWHRQQGASATAVVGSSTILHYATADKAGNRTEDSLAIFVDATPPLVTQGVLQNPILPSYIEVDVLSSEPLIAPPILTANQVTLNAHPDALDSTTKFSATYQLTGSGPINLRAIATDLAGNETDTSMTFESFHIGPAGGLFKSADEELWLDMTRGSLNSEQYLLLFRSPEGHDRVYDLRPPSLRLATPVELGLSYRSAAGPNDPPDRFGIWQEVEGGLWEPLPTLYDERTGMLIARLDRLGRFQVRAGSSGPLPRTPQLAQNYPNPWNGATTIQFTLDHSGPITLEVFNILGQRVAALVVGEMVIGAHRVTWDGRDQAGRQVASGVYYYRLRAGEYSQTRPMLLLK
ncbi:MAG: T9SS type A sorting domain-containing protein, partial [candidate division Zixibacteria bacterium]|nr:T9SS type A sorting domain-containing protein [candidate division Zixibacteria bacterium]